MTIQNTRAIILKADAKTGIEEGKASATRYENPRLSLENRAVKPIKPGWARIKILRAGICGTDVHISQPNKHGRVSSSAPVLIPPHGRIIGHEGIGRIIEVGEHVSSVRMDDIVAIESVLSCGTCRSCRSGFSNQCSNSLLLGLQVDGIFSEFADVPARSLVPINRLACHEEGLQAAACLEPAGVAMLSCMNGKIKPGDAVLIFGAGPIGALCAIIARRLFAASYILIVEPSSCRRQIASQWADQVVELAELIEPPAKGWDVVIEASGLMDNIDKVFRQIGANGRVILLGRSGNPLTISSVDHMITNAIQVMGVRGHLGGIYERLVEAYIAGLLPIAEVITCKVEGIESLLMSLHSPNVIQANCKIMAVLDD